LGEEGVFEVGLIHRKETAIAEEDSYLLEFTKEQFANLQGKLRENDLSLDAFTLNNFMKK
jgi:hypothetical protein